MLAASIRPSSKATNMSKMPTGVSATYLKEVGSMTVLLSPSSITLAYCPAGTMWVATVARTSTQKRSTKMWGSSRSFFAGGLGFSDTLNSS